METNVIEHREETYRKKRVGACHSSLTAIRVKTSHGLSEDYTKFPEV